jgi:hypothetical protein
MSVKTIATSRSLRDLPHRRGKGYWLQCVGVVVLVFGLIGICYADKHKRALTIADLVQSRTIITGYGDPILLSPNKTLYVLVTCRGNVAKNGSWIEFFIGKIDSAPAAKPAVVAKLFTKSTAYSRDLVRNLKWLADSERLIFLFDDGKQPQQVNLLNVRTGHLQQLTSQPTPVVQFNLAADNRALVYTARVKRQASDFLVRGGAVNARSVDELLRLDCVSDEFERSDYETFVQTLGGGPARKISEPKYHWIIPPEWIEVSPDSRFAIAVRPADVIPSSWDRYTWHIMRDVYLPAARSGADHFIRQFVLLDLRRLTSEPLWSAPQNPYAHLVWSPDSSHVALGPAFVPSEHASRDGLEGRVVAVIDIATRRYEELQITNDNSPNGLLPISWSADNRITVKPAAYYSPSASVETFQRIEGHWIPLAASAPGEPTKFRVEVRQDLNSPPVIFAVNGNTQQASSILELNPELQGVSLGHVDLHHWKARDGNSWTGVLFYPVHYVPGKRYPLVIQTHGYSSEFTLDGGISTAYAAQLLANAGIAVLQLGGPDDRGIEKKLLATPKEPEALGVSGYLGAVDDLDALGLIEKNKVGLVGFSRTGWHVGYAISHYPSAFAAAVTADNMDGSYVQYILTGATEFEKDIGAAPLGEGLKLWLQNAPGFNVEKISAPLRLEIDSGPITGILSAWEIFTLLRRLNKPVELFVIPDIQHGVHQLQNPAQRIASLSGTVDWFRFWLKGEEDPDPAKREQYARWRKLRKLQEKNEAARIGSKR